MTNSPFVPEPKLDSDFFRPVRWWLYVLSLLIVMIVLVGGATRLTDSGLSITEWAPVRGFIPPLNMADWQAEFLRYQLTDEFKFQNSAMTLDQFKTIYWWEWGHRFLGRLIGLAVLIPMIVFWVMGRLTPWLKGASIGLFLLVCLQGAIGWWMVKSGLVDRVDVSQLRLAIHLTVACIFLVATVWVARSLAHHSQPAVYSAFWQGGAIVLLILVQIFAGGLVAGLDAGMAYNTWPKMNGNWVPDGLLAATPIWSNFTDNALTVQFVHRVSAYLLWGVIALHTFQLLHAQPASTHVRRAWILFFLISIQACIGIITLILQVPISWALAHQLGGIVVLAFATAHWRALKPAQ